MKKAVYESISANNIKIRKILKEAELWRLDNKDNFSVEKLKKYITQNCNCLYIKETIIDSVTLLLLSYENQAFRLIVSNDGFDPIMLSGSSGN